MEKSQKKFHYAFIILFCCCMYMFVGMGVLHHFIGQYIVPVTTEMGFSLGEMNIWQTILGYTQVVMLLFAGKLIDRFGVRVCTTIASLVFVCGYIVLYFATGLWSWYIAGFIWGISSGFLAPLPVPILINAWFKKANGTFIGIAMIFSSIAGTILNPVFATIIANSGWRVGYLTQGIISFVLAFLPSLLLVRDNPAQKGLKPYGYEEGQSEAAGKPLESGITLSKAVKTPAFWTLVVLAVMLTAGGSFMQYFTGYFRELNMPIFAYAASIGMLAGVIFKAPMGAIADKMGATFVCILGAIFGMFAMVVAVFAPGSFLVYVGIALYGWSLSLAMITLPIFVRQCFGTKYYNNIWSIITMVFNLTGCTSHTIYGFVQSAGADKVQGYINDMWLAFGFYAVVLILSFVQIGAIKKVKAKYADYYAKQLAGEVE